MDDLTPREILSKFYADNHLAQDGGQSSSFVKIELTSKFYFYFPNFNARRRAVVKHDIHHLLTAYETSVWGESEISAWEIASAVSTRVNSGSVPIFSLEAGSTGQDIQLSNVPVTSKVFPSLALIHCPFTYACCRKREGSSS